MEKNKNRISLVILCMIVLLTTGAYGAKLKLPEQSREFYVYDESNIINENVKKYIIDVNKELYEKTGAQLVVATVNSLQDIDIQSYTLELFKKWEVGSKKYDNGMLMLIAPNDGEIWIETGYGLEGQFPDSKTKRIVREYMIPEFAEERFSEGIVAGFNQMLLEVEKEYDIILTKSQDVESPNNSEDEDRIVFPNIFLIIGVILLLFIDIRFFRGMIIYSLLRGLGRGGRSGGGSSRGGGSSGGGGRSGGGGAGGSW